MSDRPLAPRDRFVIRHATREAVAIVDAIDHRVDIHTLRPEAVASIGLNDIARITLRTSQPLAIDPYLRNRTTGSFILVDEATNDTLAAGMIIDT
jgi:sulfate adenylyltransferase subunit 1 (EFTu-like GTPase family)